MVFIYTVAGGMWAVALADFVQIDSGNDLHSSAMRFAYLLEKNVTVVLGKIIHDGLFTKMIPLITVIVTDVECGNEESTVLALKRIASSSR